VQAVFYPANGNRPHALSVHARFASFFALGAAAPPLLELDLNGRGDEPFSIVPPPTGAQVCAQQQNNKEITEGVCARRRRLELDLNDGGDAPFSVVPPPAGAQVC
jgi:hypothetical protein